MADWTGKAWGTDISGFQTSASFVPGVVDFGVARMNVSNGDPAEDSQFSAHIQQIWDGYAVPMAYWVVNSAWYTAQGITLQGMKNQSNDKHPILNRIQASLKYKAVGILWFDLEILGAGSVWNAAYLEDLRNRIVPLQKAGAFPACKLGLYSRNSVVSSQIDVITWLNNHPEILSWTANYRTDFPGLVASNLAQVRERRQPAALTGHAPIWFDGTARNDKRFWQYHGTGGGCQAITCPEISGNGIPSGLDLDIFEGTRAELFAMCGMTDRLGVVDPPPVVPPTDYQAQIDALAERVKALERDTEALKTWKNSPL